MIDLDVKENALPMSGKKFPKQLKMMQKMKVKS